MNLVETFLDFYGERHRMARQVVGRLLDTGFTYCLMRTDGKTADIHPLMWDDFDKNRKKVLKHVLAHTVDKGGWIEIAHSGNTFMRVYYETNGTVRYHFGGGNDSAIETLSTKKDFFLSIRKEAEALLDEDFLDDAITLVCHFFSRVPERGYLIQGFVGKERVTNGAWEGDRLKLDVEKIGIFFDFALIVLQGIDFGKAKMNNALDLMRFYGRIQTGVKRAANVLSSAGYRLAIESGGLLLFQAGNGVKPVPSDAMGPTEVRVDNTLSAMAAARAGGKA